MVAIASFCFLIIPLFYYCSLKDGIQVFFFFAIFSSTAFAQKVNFNLQQFDVQDGLSENKVMAICQDQNGFMWFGTQDGLNKFDGYRFKQYRAIRGKDNSLGNSFINALKVRDDGSLWVGMNQGGVALYRPKTDDFKRYMVSYTDSTTIANDVVKCLFEDTQQRLWIGTFDGLSLYDDENDLFSTYKYHLDDEGTRDRHYIQSICEDNKGNLWLGTQEHGIFVFETTTKTFRKIVALSNTQFTDIPGIVHDKKEHIYFVSGSKVFSYNVKSHAVKMVFEEPGNGYIYSIFLDSNKRLWIANEGLGCGYIDLSFTTPQYQNILRNYNIKTVHTMYEDKYHSLWIGTDKNGVLYHHSSQSSMAHYTLIDNEFKSVIGGNVSSFDDTSSEQVFIAMDGGKLVEFNSREQTFRSYGVKEGISTNSITKAILTKSNDLLVSTWGKGVFLFDTEKKRFSEVQENKYLNGQKIKTILLDSQNRLWVAVFAKGINVIHLNSGEVFNAENPGNYDERLFNEVKFISSIDEDDNGRVIIGTVWGLIIYDGDFHHYISKKDDPYSLASNFINSVFIDADNRIWVGTIDGLNFFDEGSGRFFLLGSENGLSNNLVSSITQDDQDYLWVCTNNGVNKARLRYSKNGQPAFEIIKDLDLTVGLKSKKFIPTTCFKAKTGELYFGGANGFKMFQPNRLEINKDIPPVHITDIKLFNQSIHPNDGTGVLQLPVLESDRIELKHHQNVITFEMTALNYLHPEDNQYAYKLEGFDTDWQYIENKREITFTNLNPGIYTLQIKASNNDGVWNEEGRRLLMEVLPPWWKTKLAIALYSILALLSIVFLIRFFSQRERKRLLKQAEKERAEKEKEMNSLKLKFFTNISHEFRNPLTLIYGPLESTLRGEQLSPKANNSLRLAYKNTKRLLRLVNQVLDFRKLESGQLELEMKQQDIIKFLRDLLESYEYMAENKSIDLTLDTQEKKFMVSFDDDKLEKILTNLLSNAFKHTPHEGSIVLKFSKGDEGLLTFEVIDSGEGINEEEIGNVFDRFYQTRHVKKSKIHGTGIGLALTKELVELHQGTITAANNSNIENSTSKLGCRFVVNIPMTIEQDSILGNQSGKKLSEKLSFDDFDSIIEAPEEALNKDRTGGQKILIVDDEEDIRYYIKQTFKERFTIYEAENGEEGVVKAIDLVPDLIISDIMMPKKDGAELCHELKNDIRTSHIPIVLLTAKVSYESKVIGLKTGADEYMDKPFNAEMLALKVDNLIKTRELLRKKFGEDIMVNPAEITTNSADEQFLKDLMSLVENNIKNPNLNNEFVQRSMGIGRTHLYNKVKSITDQTISEVIRSMRMKTAKKMLMEGRLSVKEVAFQVGFNDQRYFSRVFTKQFGVSPSDFKDSIG